MNWPRVGTRNEETREAWLEQALKMIPAGARILDAGAGEQKYRRFCQHLSYVSQDFGQYDGKGDNKGLQIGQWDQTKLDIVSDITSIPEPDTSFDAIMCIEVFEHLPSPLLALQEFYRLLRPGGYLVLTAPFCSLTHFSPFHYYSGFNKYFYETHLATLGFEIVKLESNGCYFDYVAQELRRMSSVIRDYSNGRLTICEKIIIQLQLLVLNKYRKRDQGSAELLCFGYHAFAVKRSVQ